MATNPSSGNLKLNVSDHMHRCMTSCNYLLLLIILFGCTETGPDKPSVAYPLHSGIWLGDVVPAGGAPFGALFHIVESSDVPFWIFYVDSHAEMRQLVGWPA
jgi:hypothetical protein